MGIYGWVKSAIILLGIWLESDNSRWEEEEVLIIYDTIPSLVSIT